MKLHNGFLGFFTLMVAFIMVIIGGFEYVLRETLYFFTGALFLVFIGGFLMELRR